MMLQSKCQIHESQSTRSFFNALKSDEKSWEIELPNTDKTAD